MVRADFKLKPHAFAPPWSVINLGHFKKKFNQNLYVPGFLGTIDKKYELTFWKNAV